MRLLVLIPVLLIGAIAGYNLYAEITATQPIFMIMALHAVVTGVCLTISAMVVKSAFYIKYTETNNEPLVA
ncbi:MAG: hypothetical protein ACOVRN_02720 [Flavobacterium sp.]